MSSPDFRGNVDDAVVIYRLLKGKHESEIGMKAWLLLKKVTTYLKLYKPDEI